MAHDTHGAHGAHGAPGAPYGAPGTAPAAAHAHHEEHHPTAGTYVKVGIILTIITAVEVTAYYIPAWESSWIYVPSMLILSAIKFAIVVLFYMHLKYDHKLFRALFTGPFIVAGVTIIGLMFLFGKLAIRLGLLT
jgi:cytochrome c oxidase subunit 4